MAEYVGINEHGRRVGEGHPAAKLSDMQVEMIRRLREDYAVPYGVICNLLAVPKSTIEDICLYNTRAQMPVKLKRVKK